MSTFVEPTTVLGDDFKKAKQKNVVPLSKSQRIVLIANGLLILICICIILYCFATTSLAIKAISDSREPLSNLRKGTQCDQSELFFYATHYSEYWLLRNFFIGAKVRKADCGLHVTYVTHSEDYGIFEVLPKMVKSWQAPISLIMHAPGDDFEVTTYSMQYLRNCVPESELIRDYVSFHVFFPFGHVPAKVPHDEVQAEELPFDCQSPPPYLTTGAAVSYAKRFDLPYPLNIARNLARRAANTHFVLLSDYNFQPSAFMSANFTELLLAKYCGASRSNDCEVDLEAAEREVYALPVFELKVDAAQPNNAAELNSAVARQDAQLVSLEAPAFISHRRVPYYDERFVAPLTRWHNLLQSYAMCLQSYEFLTLPEHFFLTYYADENKKPTKQADALLLGNLTSSYFKQEYSNLFGWENEVRCRNCIMQGTNCYNIKE